MYRIQVTCPIFEELVILNSAERIMAIVETLMSSEQNMGIREIADRSGVPKSSVQRLLAALQENGWVAQDPDTQNYRIGLRMLIFGQYLATSPGTCPPVPGSTERTVHRVGPDRASSRP